jgi:hypothetical protein
MELRRQALNDLMGYSNQILKNKPYDRFLVEKQQKQNPWADIVGKLAGEVPKMAATYFGAPGL